MDDFAAINEVLTRRLNRYVQQADISPHDSDRDASFASLPDLIVIDGGKGQLSAGLRALEPLLERGVAVVGLAKRIEEIFLPGRKEPILLRKAPTPSGCSSGSATRPTALRSPSTAAAATRR